MKKYKRVPKNKILRIVKMRYYMIKFIMIKIKLKFLYCILVFLKKIRQKRIKKENENEQRKSERD